MVKAVFFDFDGTISDARKIAIESLEEVLEEYKIPYSKKKLEKAMGAKTEKILEDLGIVKTIANPVRKKLFKKMIKRTKNGELKLCVSTKPLEEMKKDYKLIVVSNSQTAFIKVSAKELGIKKLFKEIHGSEKFNTKDEILKKLFKKHKIKPSEAAYVGDRFSDIEYAKKAGCLAIAIHNKCSWSTKKVIMAEKPDYLIKDFYDLKKILKKL